MNKYYSRILLLCAFAIYLSLNPKPAFPGPAEKKLGIPAKLAADYVHAVIEASRTTYSASIVDRLDKKISLTASEKWEVENTLLLPAQFLITSSKISNARGSRMGYRLVSLWPINEENSPSSEMETVGLQEVVKNPKVPFTWIGQRGGEWYFEVIYPDKAVAETCVTCHNSHPNTPKTDFKLGDVMGGIIVDLPLGRRKKIEQEYWLAPEVVADYVHSVLESNRAVYAKHVVDRLENKNIVHAKEDWWEENALMLPAQFLLNTSDLIKKNELGLDFRLISLWAINPQNSPANEFERIGLETVDVNPLLGILRAIPNRPFISRTTVGGKQYFKAIYPDFAVTNACVTCHNAHPKSPKRDFELYDVMGGMVVTFPLN